MRRRGRSSSTSAAGEQGARSEPLRRIAAPRTSAAFLSLRTTHSPTNRSSPGDSSKRSSAQPQATARVNVVCPLHTSTIRHWVSDLDGARAEAKNRVQRAVEVLRVHGCETRGEIGDEDALQAIEDELRTFGADEIIVLTRHGARAGELDPSIVEQARTRFALPITHLVAESRPEPARA